MGSEIIAIARHGGRPIKLRVWHRRRMQQTIKIHHPLHSPSFIQSRTQLNNLGNRHFCKKALPTWRLQQRGRENERTNDRTGIFCLLTFDFFYIAHAIRQAARSGKSASVSQLAKGLRKKEHDRDSPLSSDTPRY